MRRDRPLFAVDVLYFLGEDSCTGECWSSIDQYRVTSCVNCRLYNVAGDIAIAGGAGPYYTAVNKILMVIAWQAK